MFSNSPIWILRGRIISWTIFFFILFVLQLLFMISQLSFDSPERQDERNLKIVKRRYKIDVRSANHPLLLKANALKTILNKILNQKSRPSDSTYNFNVSRSNSIPLDRNIPDTRPVSCSSKVYHMPVDVTVSVIIVFHNEALSTLLRTVHSILNRSPYKTLKEVILVDDLSSTEDLGVDLETYIRALDPRVRILRNEQRQGLVRSRLRGADNATGTILVWLDAHTECNTGWLEPLIHELVQSNVTIVQPHVDVISANTIEFYAYPGDTFRGGFGWDLRYSWYKLPNYLHQSLRTDADPFPTPVLVGCAIAARRDHFDATGQFDDGLNIWGGEHFDLSFRTWLCGGRILTVPCSRVGHMFKESTYGFDGDRATVIRKNLMRIADIWLDEYKWVFDAVSLSFGPDPFLTREEITSRIKRKLLRQKLNCKPFRWFMEHVMPEIKVPSESDLFFGELTNVKTSLCWQPLPDGYIGMTGECFKHRILPENHFSLDDKHRLRHDRDCIYIDGDNWLLRKRDCNCSHDLKGGQWRFLPFSRDGGQIIHEGPHGATWCAKHVSNITPKHYGMQMVQMGNCDPKDAYQLWTFTYKLSKNSV